MNERKITMGRPDNALPDNAIHTSKYNFFTFLPKNILEQYSKIANVYFLGLGILQMISSITNSDGQPTIWLPLFAINIATAGKDLYEDIKRKNQDSDENNS
jgi:phospholipid-transporting ATPase